MLSEMSLASELNLEQILIQKEQENYNIYWNFVQIEVLKELPALEGVVKVVTMFITHALALLVLIFAIYFRLSISMFVFVFIYMNYYRQINATIFKKMEEYNLQHRTF